MRSVIVLVAFVYANGVVAQSSIDLFTLAGFYGSPAPYEEPLDGKATESGGLINLKMPVKLSRNTMWYNDFTYSRYVISTGLDPEPAEFLTSMSLHAFILQTGIVRKLNDRNGLQLLFVPRNNSDLKGSDPNNWQFGAIALYEHRHSEKLLLRFGVLYNNELFGPLVVPLIYGDWYINDRWSMVGLLPINLKINHKISDRLTGGFSHFGFITTYRISQEQFGTDYVERNSIDESLFLRWKMAGNLHLETRVGYSLARVYEQYSEDQKMDLRISIIHVGDERVQKNVNFGSGPIASLRLVYNLPLN
jgi:hypothetical protein